MNNYDVVVIGAGNAALSAALSAKDNGAKKILELNENQICLHSKKIRFEIKDENYEFEVNEPSFFNAFLNV